MSLRTQAYSGVRWRLGSSSIVALVDLVRLGILARLATADDFGLMGMAMVAIGFVGMYGDLGTGTAFIQRQNVPREEQDSLFWFNLFMGCLQFGALAALSPLIAWFYGEPRVTALICFAATIYLARAATQQFRVFLRKELRFAAFSMIEVVSSIVICLASITGAWFGWGAWALVGGHVAGAIASALLVTAIVVPAWRPSFRFSFTALKSYLGFGLYQTGDRFIAFLSTNVDSIMIGRWLGTASLGTYTLAYRLVTTPMNHLVNMLMTVAFPILARKQADMPALRRGFLEVAKAVAMVAMPAVAGLALIAPLAIPLILGPTWAEASLLVRLLVFTALARGLTVPASNAMLAVGRPDINFKWNLATTLLKILVFWIVLAPAGGSLAVFAAAYVGLALVYTVAFLQIAFAVLRLPWREYLLSLFKPTACALAMALVAGTILSVAHTMAIGQALALALTIGAGTLVYTVGLVAVDRRYLMELYTHLRFRRREVHEQRDDSGIAQANDNARSESDVAIL